MSSQYGELWPTGGWDLLASFGHPSKFQLVSRLGSVTAWTLVVGVSQTLRHWTEGATCIRQGGHHIGHWPTFLVAVFCAVWFPIPSAVLQLQENVTCYVKTEPNLTFPIKQTKPWYGSHRALTEPEPCFTNLTRTRTKPWGFFPSCSVNFRFTTGHKLLASSNQCH